MESTVVDVRKVQTGEGRGLADGERIERTLRRIAGDAVQAGSPGRSCKTSRVSDAVRGVDRCAWTISGIVSVIDYAAGGIDGLSDVAGEVEIIRGSFRDVAGGTIGGALIFVDAPMVRRIDLIAPNFGTGGVGYARPVPDILTRR